MSSMDLFKRRMELLTPDGRPGEAFVDRTNIVENKLFTHDQNFQHGMLYDWDMQPIEEVDFKFEKVRTHTADGVEVEYHIHFRPDFNPEYEYRDLYYKADEKERLGFYIDVYDRSKKIYDKWLIVGKDNRVAFDRYNAYKCNWCFEWIYEGEYHQCLGCVRSAAENSFEGGTHDKLGGSTVKGELAMIVPTTMNTMTILLGQKFIISDNFLNPQTFQVTKIKDTMPLGIIRATLKQKVFNPHRDVCGDVNSMTGTRFTFDLPIADLDPRFGGRYHMLCDCILSQEDTLPTAGQTALYCPVDALYYTGTPVTVSLQGEHPDTVLWRYEINGYVYAAVDLRPCFDIQEYEDHTVLQVIDRDMVKYTVTVQIYDENRVLLDEKPLEVKL